MNKDSDKKTGPPGNIDPEILKRVSKAVGAEIPPDVDMGAIMKKAAASAGGSTSPQTSKKGAGKPQTRSRSASQLSELKARIRKREATLDSPQEKEDPRKSVQFVIFDDNSLRAKQISAYLNQMGFPKIEICRDPQAFVQSVLTNLNNDTIKRIAVAVPEILHTQFRSMIRSSALSVVRQRVPQISQLPVFVFHSVIMTHRVDTILDPQLVIHMKKTPEFNEEKVRTILGI